MAPLLYLFARTNAAKFCCFSPLFVDAAALYWRPSAEGFGYAVKSSSQTELEKGSKVLDPSFEWDFGFRLGFGYWVPHDHWELLLELTHFNTHADTKRIAHGGVVFFPSWNIPEGAPPLFAEKLKMHWRLHFALVDLVVEKRFFVGTWLQLKPRLGLQYGSIRQKFNLHYREGNLPNGGSILEMKNKFSGVGPQLGLEGQWGLIPQLSLFSSLKASLLYGHFYLHQSQNPFLAGSKVLGMHEVYPSVQPLAEWSIGLRWGKSYTGGLKRITLDLEWNQTQLFSQNQLLRFVSAKNRGLYVPGNADLSLEGVQLAARFDF